MKEAVRFAVFLGVLIVSILILGSVGVVGFIVAMVVGFALGGWVYDELLPSIWTTVSKANKTGQTTGQPSFANSSVQHEDAHRDFLVRSYDKWREGKFDFLSGDYRKKTSDHASGTLAVNLLGEKEFCDFLSLCLRAREAVKQSDFRQGWNLSRGGAVPWGCVGRPSVLPFEFRRRSGEPAGARFSPWRGLAGAFRLAPYAGSGANSNRRCRLNVSAAHAASQLTFSSPRVANRRSFNFVLIQALGNSASGARCL